MHATLSTTTRAKRFERRENPSGLQLTLRDMRILSWVARHRFLSSEHLVKLDGGSQQNLLRCLRVLFDHGFLDRPHAQLAHLPISGPRPMVYGLGRRGAATLRKLGYQLPKGTDWTERNKRAGAVYIEHTLEVAAFMASLEVGARNRPDIHVLWENDILRAAPERTRAAREPLRWSVPKLEKTIGVGSVIADGMVGFVYPDNTAAYFLLELDRGTMPVTRRSYTQSSFARKLRIYYEGWKLGRQVEQFGIKQLRVLTVTNTRERLKNMVEASQRVTGGSGANFFLFADQASLAANDPLSVEWISGKGEAVRLTD